MKPYDYHVTGRDAYYLIVTLIGVAMVLGAIVMDAPWWILAIWGSGAILLIWRFYLNPKAGMTLDGSGLHYYGEGQTGFITAQEIDRVHIIAESDGPDRVTVHLKEGGVIILPQESYPTSGRLRAQLARFDIAHNAP
ncbi:MAG: hypothetical protein AAGK92_07215 [Pseudomonadota bacterium]